MNQILVIEDEPAIADAVEYALRTENFQVTCCGTGEEGLKALAGGGYVLVILDVGLPDQNGFEVFRRVRASSPIPVIFLTARADEIDRVAGLEMGADDYVVKPFSPRELSARVRAVLRRSGEGRSGAAAPGFPFAIDEERCQVLYFSQPLILARYEYKLLTVLISRPGWVFSRDRLKELVWDDPDSSTDRTVDTHIKTIRGELRRIKPELDPIVTHRGMGYSLREDW